MTGPVLWVGTIKSTKRPELFIELARRHPARRFVMVGGAQAADGCALDFYERTKALAHTVPNVEFVGPVPFDSVGAYFDRAALLINTSMTEGFPNTFLQAWIRGVPSVSFVAPTIGQEATGTIRCNDVDEMSATIASLLIDGGRWAAASARVRSHFARVHGLESVLPVYEAILSGKSCAA
jgi:glycosyltransferase involved in cell wall biosynthesis